MRSRLASDDRTRPRQCHEREKCRRSECKIQLKSRARPINLIKRCLNSFAPAVMGGGEVPADKTRQSGWTDVRGKIPDTLRFVTKIRVFGATDITRGPSLISCGLQADELGAGRGRWQQRSERHPSTHRRRRTPDCRLELSAKAPTKPRQDR